MNIKEGLIIKEDLFVNWSISFEELHCLCEKNNVDYQLEIGNMLKKIELPINFANLGKVKANFYFKDEFIKEIYITRKNDVDFCVDRYFKVKKKLILYFGSPKLQNAKKIVRI